MEGAALLASAAAKSGSGSSELLSGIVGQLWSHLNVALAKAVKEAVEPSFKTLPGPLATLRFVQLDLGRVPIRIDNVVVHDEHEDSLQFDMDIVWDGDCSIQLKADYVGTFGVGKVKLFGRMSVLMSPLIQELPVVTAVQYNFINPPTFELDFLGLANLADMSVVDSKIRKIIQDVIGGMMVLPNRMLFKMDPLKSYLDIYKPPLGVARIKLVEGSGFLGESKKMLSMQDAHDVYCHVELGGTTLKSTVQLNSDKPSWNETFDFLVFDFDQIVDVHAYDEDVNGDDDLGSAKIAVRELLLGNKTSTVSLHGGTYDGGKISLSCELFNLSHDLESLENSNDTASRMCGLVTILVVGAHDLPVEKEKAASLVTLVYEGSEDLVTGVVAHAEGVDALNPVFDKAFHVPLKSKLIPNFELKLLNGEDKDLLGSTSITQSDLVKAKDGTISETRKIGHDGATLEFLISVHGLVESSEDISSRVANTAADAGTSTLIASGSTIGKVKLTLLKAWGFEVEKSRRVFKKKDIPDIYCNVTFGSSPTVWKTATIRNSTAPEWNESQEYVLSDHGQIVNIEVFDEDKGGNEDDEQGGARIKVGKLLLAGGVADVELLSEGSPTGCFLSLRCEMVE